MNSATTNSTPNSMFSPYLLSRFHQHLNHLNDMAFAHTKILQEIMEKHSNEPITSSPRGSMSSSSSSSSSTIDSIQQQKRSFSSMDNHEIKNENHLNKRPRKQSKPQHLRQNEHSKVDEQSSSEEEEEDEEEMGEIIEPMEKQTSPILPFPSNNLPFLNYIQELARTNHLNSPVLMGRFLDNLTNESRRIPFPTPPPPLPPTSTLFPPTIPSLPPGPHSHPYLSQMLFNSPLLSSTPAFNRFIPPSSHPSNLFHFSTPKKRRTKVTDTRLSPRMATKIPVDDLTDDEHSSSHHSSDGNPSKSSDHPSIEYHGFQISDFPSLFPPNPSPYTLILNFREYLRRKKKISSAFAFCSMYVGVLTPLHLRKAKLMFFYTRYPNSAVLKIFFPDVRFNKLITAQLVKWFSNFREFFYQQIEKYARQCLAEGIRNVEDLIITPNSDLYRVLNTHYNRSNQINVPLSFCTAVQVALREFFLAIQQQKDLESSWKKSIYKVMGRLDDQLPDFFKNDHWMHSI